jgi:hypothetical protein
MIQAKLQRRSHNLALGLTGADGPMQTRGGAIIMTGSVTGLLGNKNLLDYSMTKGGIHAFLGPKLTLDHDYDRARSVRLRNTRLRGSGTDCMRSSESNLSVFHRNKKSCAEMEGTSSIVEDRNVFRRPRTWERLQERINVRDVVVRQYRIGVGRHVARRSAD